MSLPHVILALLQQQEQTGYDLKTSCFDRSIAPLWTADQAHIYRTLDRLAEQGCINCTIEVQHDRPNRKIYNITPAGEAELRNWLQAPQPLPTVREPFLMQLFLGAQLPNEVLIDLLSHQTVAHLDRLATCETAQAAIDTASGDRDHILQHLVLELLRQRETLYLSWLEQVATAVEGLGIRG